MNINTNIICICIEEQTDHQSISFYTAPWSSNITDRLVTAEPPAEDKTESVSVTL